MNEHTRSRPSGIAAAGQQPAVANAFMVSTHDLPERDAFEGWRDSVRRLVGAECSTESTRSFRGEILIRSAGPTRLTRWHVDESRYERTPALAAHGEDACTLTLSNGGDRVIGPDESEWTPIDSGGGFFLAHDRPFTVAASRAAPSLVVVVERGPLSAHLPAGTELSFRHFPRDHPLLGLIRGYAHAITGTAEQPSHNALDMMGQHVVDLIALLLRPSGDAIEVIAGRGLKAARTQAVLDAISRHHARPDLSADMVGRELGISARQIHRLLEETPKTFYEHVLERRLCRAHEMLSGGAGAGIPIAEIAHRCGFVGISHFSRSFATRFGMTPSAVRTRALN